MTNIALTATTPAPSTTPAAAAPRTRPLRAAVRSEWIKLRSLRSTPAVVGLTAVVGAGMALVLGKAVKTDPYEHLPFTVANTFLVSSWLTTLLAVVVGTLLFTSEVQHGTLAAAFTARPTKRVVIAGKAVVAAGLGLAMGAVGVVASLLAGIAGGLPRGDFSGAASGTAWALLLTSLAAVLGLGIGLVVRHSAGAVTATLVYALAVENLVRGMAPVGVSRWLPFHAANRLLGTRSATDTTETLAAAFSNAGNAALFGAYAVAAVVAGTALLMRKDA